jgi:hypothetical protein
MFAFSVKATSVYMIGIAIFVTMNLDFKHPIGFAINKTNDE